MVDLKYIINRRIKSNYITFLKAILAKNVSFKEIAENKIDYNKDKVLCVRHDIINKDELLKALAFAKLERDIGIRSTYFLLYDSDFFDYSNEFLACCKYLNETGHDIGIHNNSITTYLQNKKYKSFKEILSKPIDFLRSYGIEVYGTSSCQINKKFGYKYHNYEMWKEFDKEKNEGINVTDLPIISYKELGLLYETYFINYHSYLSDFDNNWCGYITTKGRAKLIDSSLIFSNKNTKKETISRFNSYLDGGIFQLSINVSSNWWLIY